MVNYAKIIKTAFNSFNGKNLELLDDFYSKDVIFEDPLTRTEGITDLKRYYQHAYKNVKSIEFIFLDFVREGQTVAGTWEMHLQANGLNRGRTIKVKGMSHFKFNEEKLVCYHRDYLDIGSMVYEYLPLQGFIIRQIKRLLVR
jgi:hypothetical protein